MPDPTGTPDPDPTPVALVGADGNFAENWRDHPALADLPEDIRKHESLKVVTDLPNAIKQLVTANKMVGKDKVVVPGPNATDEEKAEFFTAIGRPKTVADYKVEIPKELKDVFDEGRMAKAKETAHRIGATQEQFAAYMKAEAEAALQLLKDEDEQHDLDIQNADNELRKRFGGAYDERMHVANRLIEEICKGDETRKFTLLQSLDNADVAEFISDCGAKLVEHKALIAEITRATPKEAEAKMTELRSTPGYILPDPQTGKLLIDSDPAKQKAITDEIAKLVKDTYPDARSARPGI